MTTRWLFLSILCLTTSLGVAATNEPTKAEIEGQQLAQQLRELRPAETASLNGVLKIFRPKQKPVVVPVEFKTTVTATNWQTEYIARGTNAETTATVTIIHADQQPTQYRLGDTALLTSAASMTPFAGSDFWLADLGLEFLHWPGQKVLKHDMKSGQACKVLESTNPEPGPNGYARIVAWIDSDTGGVVVAEAYDARGNLLKEFEPKGVTKVRGQWQVDEMLIINDQTKTRTRLEFNFDAK